MKFFIKFSLILLWAMLSPIAHNMALGDNSSLQNQDLLNQEALGHLTQGHFSEAAKKWESLWKDMEYQNAYVFYNLGVAYFHQKEIGKAMAAFLAALRLKPRDPEIRANLSSTYQQIPDDLLLAPMQKQSFLTSWIQKISEKEWAYLCAIFWGLFFIMLGVRILKPKHTLYPLVGTGAFLFLVFASFFSWGLYAAQNQKPWGAIAVDQSEVLSSPGKTGVEIFKLHEGAPFALEQIWNPGPEGAGIGAWYQIKVWDKQGFSKKGWVSAAHVALFLN